MQLLIDLVSSLFAFFGHFALCVWLFNRLHAFPWRRFTIKWLGRAILGFGAGMLVVYGLRAALFGVCVWRGTDAAQIPWLIYPAFCSLVTLVAIPLWLVPKLRTNVPIALLSNDTTLYDLVQDLGQAPIGSGETRLLARFPGNQIFHLAVQRKTLRMSQLPDKLSGLTIAHLSDLHMTGKLSREFYDAIVYHTNQLEADLIVITGDIAEKVKCLDWIVPVLSRLRAREGKYFILGNHEMKLPDPDLLRQRMVEAGFIDVGSKAISTPLRGTDILVAGSEVPWFGSNPLLTPDPSPLSPVFRLLLSHSPDQLCWAKANRFDLMLAGHTHGGQIRFPFFGALISPSKFGFRYAGGLYYEEPTLMHVSRGLCGDHPIRLNCPPELALLTLVGDSPPDSSGPR